METSDAQLILIDEPEAFMHPPLAFRMGQYVARAARRRNKQVICATHSSDFLLGCMSAKGDLRALRVEYKAKKSRGHLVETEDLKQLLNHPLVRNSNVASSLFHDGAVVTESSNDSIFYQEITRRISAQKMNPVSIHFLNAQNKTTTRDIIGPLRRLGVPAAVIVDLDIIKNGGKDWSSWLDAAYVPEIIRSSLEANRLQILNRLNSANPDWKRAGGLAVLNKSDAVGAVEFFGLLEKYGLFIVTKGELEAWLKNLAVVGSKTDWTINMLIALGGDPDKEEYVLPGTDDVWEFVRRVVRWIEAPDRLGMPN